MKLEEPKIVWGENNTPISIDYDDVYFNPVDGFKEAHHVFVQKNDLLTRFESSTDFTIAETGFGTGLNFLVTLELWLANNPNGRLHYIAFEKYPPLPETILQALVAFPSLKRFTDALLAVYPDRIAGWHQVSLFDQRVQLTLWFGDAIAGLTELNPRQTQINAWFLDGFTPSKNPEMWQPALYQNMARLSNEATTFATFTSASEVRQELAKMGFEVRKYDGFRYKKEMCAGRLQQKRPFHSKTPWFDLPKKQLKVESAIVVGAGLSGAAVAYALARNGIKVTVLESESDVAQQASSNLAGAIHPLVTADWNIRSRLYYQGFQTTLKWLSEWVRCGEVVGDLNGLVQLAVDPVHHERCETAHQRFNLPDTFMQLLNAQDASSLAGTATPFSAAFFPGGGWIEPSSVVRKCLSHSNISVKCQKTVLEVNALVDTIKGSTQVQLMTDCGEMMQADVVILASGITDVKTTGVLPEIKPLKGQTSYISKDNVGFSLNKTVTHKGYTVSLKDGVLTGATFMAQDMLKTKAREARVENLTMLSEAFSDVEITCPNVRNHLEQDNVAFRPTVSDHLPVVGAVPDAQWIEQAYLSQSHTHVVYRYPAQKYVPGLYISNGHGARGLMSVFLAAEMLEAEILDLEQKVPESHRSAMHPAKYMIRKWRKGGFQKK